MLALFACATAAAVQPAPRAPAPNPPAVVREEVPQDAGPQDVHVLTREFPVGGSSGWHTHPGVEIGYVLEGETEMRGAGGEPRIYRAGQIFTIPRGMVHNGVNVGQGPARLVITYVTDRGADLRSPANPPSGQ
jgi:quercetin dioxygenase-like cupin family protein